MPIPVSVLFRNPTMSQPKLSPDGKHIAFAFSNAELQRVFVRSVDGKSSLDLAEFSLEKVRLRGFDWANSGRLILGADAPDPKEQGVQPMVKWAVEQGIPDPERVVIGLRGADILEPMALRLAERLLMSGPVGELLRAAS